MATKMCCVFCKAMGKPEGDWSTHWVKDKVGGVVVCPELLKNECGYCHAIGHTPKFCPKLKARDERLAKRKAARKSHTSSRQLGAWIQPKIKAGVSRNLGWSVPVTKSQTKTVSGPKPVVPKPPQGAWNAAHKAEVDTLKAELGAMKARLAAVEQTEALKAFLIQESVTNFVGEQTLEETAEGEAFFDNDADAEEAVTEIASMEQPLLVRQGAFGGGDGVVASLPKPKLRREATTAAKAAYLEEQAEAIPLPTDCNLDEDFGDGCDDGWGSC